jgi:hypothetical protein
MKSKIQKGVNQGNKVGLNKNKIKIRKISGFKESN